MTSRPQSWPHPKQVASPRPHQGNLGRPSSRWFRTWGSIKDRRRNTTGRESRCSKVRNCWSSMVMLMISSKRSRWRRISNTSRTRTESKNYSKGSKNKRTNKMRPSMKRGKLSRPSWPNLTSRRNTNMRGRQSLLTMNSRSSTSGWGMSRSRWNRNWWSSRRSMVTTQMDSSGTWANKKPRSVW